MRDYMDNAHDIKNMVLGILAEVAFVLAIIAAGLVVSWGLARWIS